MPTPEKQRAPYLTPETREPLIDLGVVATVGGDALRGRQYLAPEFQTEAAKADTVVAQMAGMHDVLRTGLEGLQRTLRVQDPAMTEEANFLDLNRRTNGWIEAVANQATVASTQAKRTSEALDNDIRSKLEISEGPRSNEIRSHFKAMKNGDGLSLALKAIEAGDKETTAAILSGPAYLSGLSDEQQNMLRNQMALKFAGDLVSRKNVIEKAMAVNDRAFNELLLAVGQIFPKHRVDEITKRMQTAKKDKDDFFKL
ncbi:hypothetical protein [Mesorhizobium sp. B1-1-5]|uniref:hypothetical protein n=1 Tax=Mesorhizobium sp. B1-1-5 TaxID=2589979 RepID=UPI00112640A3|nr:hypothetical protein [Mesorhizobium sp. B1-1-5]TPO07133.1 hypothetical protein FJ980_12480 [Mesorhizobium sp. B1-1-5]